MSFAWSTARTNLATLFTRATGLRCIWVDGPQDFAATFRSTPSAEAHGELSLKTIGGKGVDQLSHTYDEHADPGEELTMRGSGLRSLLWQVRVRSWRSAAGLDAIAYLDTLRSHLRAPYADTLLRDASCGVESVAMMVDLGAINGDRRESVGQMDIMLCAYVETTLETTTWIEHAYGESTWRDADGVALSASLQIDGELS